MASTASIYARVAGSRIRSHYQFRLSFTLQLIGAFGLSFLDFVAILVIFHHVHRLAGWSIGEIAFLYGSSYIVFKLADLVMTNMDRLPNLIREGAMDQVLTRPLGTLGQVITGDIDLRQIGASIQGVVVFSYALSKVHIVWTPGRTLVLVSMLVSSFFIFAATYLMTNAVAFWIMDAREVANAFTYGGNFMTQMPMSIYGPWLRKLLGFGAALAFVNYFPALYILGKNDPLHEPSVLRFLSPAVAAVACVLAGSVWRLAVRHYRSTGS